MEDFSWPFHLRFFIALALSFLIGLERESSGKTKEGRIIAGVRTYSIIGIFGFGCAWLSDVGVTWAVPVGLLALSALALSGYQTKVKTGRFGWTSEIMALLTFVIGALCLLGDIWVPMALGIIGTFLLSEKSKLENYVKHLDQTEFLAVIKFLLVALIILPVLPDREYFEFQLNPRKTWQIVVLVSSVGFIGYYLSKKFGHKVGLWLSGLLGGIVSSTAVTIAVARVAHQSPEKGVTALQASILASSVMYLRIMALIWILRPDFLHFIWWKGLALFGIGAVLAVTTTEKSSNNNNNSIKTLQNPFEIKPAMIFAVLFVILSVATVLVEKFYGDVGLLVLAGIIGITDIDPFILSLINQTVHVETLMSMAILLSMMSNTLAKGFYFTAIAKGFHKQTLIRYGIWAILHIPLLFI
ncbi:MAG: MgtC/SapB family protein [candidate division Zixibacteria bacterium]|nr:MgtC/SapB family protein [candidate division Zixibacteria bacterium]